METKIETELGPNKLVKQCGPSFKLRPNRWIKLKIKTPIPPNQPLPTSETGYLYSLPGVLVFEALISKNNSKRIVKFFFVKASYWYVFLPFLFFSFFFLFFFIFFFFFSLFFDSYSLGELRPINHSFGKIGRANYWRNVPFKFNIQNLSEITLKCRLDKLEPFIKLFPFHGEMPVIGDISDPQKLSDKLEEYFDQDLQSSSIDFQLDLENNQIASLDPISNQSLDSIDISEEIEVPPGELKEVFGILSPRRIKAAPGLLFKKKNFLKFLQKEK